MTKYFPWFFLIALCVLVNYKGHCASLQNISNLPITVPSTMAKTSTPVVIIQITPSENSKYPMNNKPFIVFALVSVVISTTLYILILNYLNGHSLVNTCVLLYLYKDVVKLIMAMNIVWFLGLVIRYSCDNEHSIYKAYAKIMCMFVWGMMFLFLILMNVIAILKMYMMKKMLVDPPMPWGEDENLGISIIRIASCVLVIIFVAIMWTLGIHPNTYYIYTGDEATLHTSSVVTAIFPMLITFFLVTFTITSLGTKYFQLKHRQNIDTGITSEINCFPLIIVIFFAFVLFTGIFYWKNERWKFYLILGRIVSVLAPLFVILKTPQLRSHVNKTLQDKVHEILHLNVKFVIMCVSIYIFVSLCVN